MTNASRVINSAFFSVAAKLLGKSLGLISTIIIARILAPEDFGLIAIVSMALYFFDILSHAAGEQYIVQKRSVSRADRDTAWSLNLCLKLGIAALIVISSPVLASFFEHPELKSAFMTSALILPLQALKSPSLLLLRRQLKFKPLFWLSLCERLVALPALVGFAFWLQSFWAFLITDILVATFGSILSYSVARGLPRFSLKKVSQQWRFSQWMLSKSFLGYLRSQIDTLFVAKFFSPDMLGQYHMARDLAMMPAHYLLSPAVEPLLAVFKNDKQNLSVLLNNLVFALFVACLIALPVCAVLVVFAKPLIWLLLGDNWEIAAQLLPILAWLFFYWSIAQVIESALIAQGRVKWLFGYDLFSLICTTSGLAWAVLDNMTLFQMALLRVITGSLAMLILLFATFRNRFRFLLPLFALVGMLASVLVVTFSFIQYYAAPVLASASFSFHQVLRLSTLGVFGLLLYSLACLAMCKWFQNAHAVRLVGMLPKKLKAILS